MRDGRVIQMGTPTAILDSPAADDVARFVRRRG